jgi:hypothetical protein
LVLSSEWRTSAFLAGLTEEKQMASERTLSAHAGSTARTAGIILMSIVLWSLTAGHIFGDSPENPTNAKPAKAALLAVPLSFEANQGQTDSQVKFLSRGDGYSLFLTSNEVVFSLRTRAGVKAPPSVFRMELLGADRNAQVSGADNFRARPTITSATIRRSGAAASVPMAK